MYPLFAKAPCTALHYHVRFAPESTHLYPRLIRIIILQTILVVTVSVLTPTVAHADSATWDLNPTSGDWNTAANWMPMAVPNGQQMLRRSAFPTPPTFPFLQTQRSIGRWGV